MKRTCKQCKFEKEISDFKEVFRKNQNYFLNKCKDCVLENRTQTQKKLKHLHYLNNKDIYKERSKVWVINNPEKFKERISSEKYKQIKKISNKKWRENNKEKVSEYFKNKLKTDINRKVRSYLSSRISAALLLKGTRKHKKTRELIGCSIIELRQHLESKFLPTMTWENYGKYWHIDHIIPCSSFDLSTEEEQNKCFHYSNLQPLFAITQIINGIEYIGNISKGGTNRKKL